MTIWRMRTACRISKATNTHSEHVIRIVFHSTNGCTNEFRFFVTPIIACIVLNWNIITFPKRAIFWIKNSHCCYQFCTCVEHNVTYALTYYCLDIVHHLVFNKARFGSMPCFCLQTRKEPNLVDPLHGGQSPTKKKLMSVSHIPWTEPYTGEVHVSSTLPWWRHFDLWPKDATKVQKWP
jgi:hypothetical protein